jgi:hypothetical protein
MSTVLQKLRVGIVDDDDDSRFLVRYWLEMHGSPLQSVGGFHAAVPSNGLQIDYFGRGSEQSEGRVVILPEFRGVNFTGGCDELSFSLLTRPVEGDTVENSGKTLTGI